MQPIPRDSNDNGVVTMLVYHNKPTLLLTVHQHGGDDVTCIRSIRYEETLWPGTSPNQAKEWNNMDKGHLQPGFPAGRVGGSLSALYRGSLE